MKNRFIFWLILLLALFSIVQNFGQSDNSTLAEGDLGVATNRTEYKQGKEVQLSLQNNTEENIYIYDACNEIPYQVFEYENGQWITASETYETPCAAGEERHTLEPGTSYKVSYLNWSNRLFNENSRYRIELLAAIGDPEAEPQSFSSNEFTIESRGIISRTWLEVVYKPILNTLVFLIEKVPGHSLGLAIILLTLFIRTLLLVPSQRAMKAQKKMQEVQPKLDEIRKKYKDNQEKLAMETMKVWQTHKVNPFGSCLLMLIQFPILIALYYVVSAGLHPDKTNLLYSFVGENFSFDMMQTNFLGVLELTEINFFVLPLIVGGLQFLQMHLALARAKKKKEAVKKEKGAKEVAKKVEGTQDMQEQMQMATSMMKYVMPIMIAFFTASLPAGVGLYWGTSTLYGIAQQIVVNKESTQSKDENEPTVRVIETDKEKEKD